MNILLVNNLWKSGEKAMVGGVEYHRMAKPNQVLRRHYPEYDLLMTSCVSDELPQLKQTDLVIFSRTIHEGAAELLNEMGIPFGLDLDDWWILPENHIAYEDYMKHDIPTHTLRSIREAHFIICTTPILAEKIQPINSNVFVIENGIDSEDPIWTPNKVPSDRVRFGFTQGNSHYHDIKSIAKSVVDSFNDIGFYKKAQVVLCGFDAEDKTWKKMTYEQAYELMLTNNHKCIKHEKDYLLSLVRLEHPDGTNMPYRRIWSLDVDLFGQVYNEFDVLVAPLLNGEFNRCKSELKMLEAGFMDCAVIVNHNEPYTLLANDGNSFNLNKNSFREIARLIINNPNLVADKKAQLRLDVERYDLKHLNKKRHELYQKYKK
jgi:hypothetical protein